ncbi:MAG: sulfatase-like hydrolase/transferase [Akkermansiaceae bacterium]
MMKHQLFLPILLAAFGSLQAAQQPNIIIYMVDDLGWNHISAKLGTMGTAKKLYQTPHLEKFAQSGLSFTHAYAQPNCAPTRAAMLSGQYPARINNDVYVVGNLNRNGRGGISKADAKFIGPEQTEDVAAAAITVAEALKKNGYATAHIGKYHVGGHSGEETMPENAGFDINLGGYMQGHQPTCFATGKNGKWQFKGVGLGHFNRFAQPYDDGYLKDRNLPASLSGAPKHISDALGDAMEETIGKLHAAGKPFYLQFHTYAVHGPVRARPDLKAAAAKSAGGNAKMAEYAGFIAGVDENMGRLLKVIEDPNHDGDTADSIAANTLILFTSDNGGTHTDNLPLRGVKGMLTEGGIRVPLIARWPGVIPANTVTDRKVHVIDYYPTYLELAGNKWSPPVAEHPLDGESFAASLREPEAAAERGPVFYLFPGYMDKRAQPSLVVIDDIEDKRYKLHYYYEADVWELYLLNDDQSEAKNLIRTQPEIAATLSKKLDSWLGQSHPTWKPKLPIRKSNGQPAAPPTFSSP